MEKSSCTIVEDKNDEATVSRGEKRSPSCDSSSNETTLHRFSGHVETSSVDCPVINCDTQLPTEALLCMHLQKEHKVFKYRCVAPKCTYNAGKPSKLLKHIKTKHGNLKSWKCSSCSKEFPTWIDLRDHNKENHERGSFKCNFKECSFTSINRLPVMEHFRDTHHSNTKKARIADKNSEEEIMSNENSQTANGQKDSLSKQSSADTLMNKKQSKA